MTGLTLEPGCTKRLREAMNDRPRLTNLEKSRKDIEKHLSEVKVKAKEISGFIAPDKLVGEPFLNGRYQRDGYSVGKYAIMGEGDYAIPILLFVPNDTEEKHPAVIYLHPKGKQNQEGRLRN